MIDFVKLFRPFVLISLFLFIASIFIIINRLGSQTGLEFSGGNLFTFECKQQEVGLITQILRECGYKDYQIKSVFNEDVCLLRTGLDFSVQNFETCMKGQYKLLSFESFSPVISKEITNKGFFAGLIALVFMFIYLVVRFEKTFAIAACVALAHDVVISLGLYLLFGQYLTLQALVGALTLIGYSINDTIIVFDRIREELAKEGSLTEIINRSINVTLSRTLKTSFLTLVAVLIILLFGREAIFDFALYFFIGIIIGTYSSIFIAAPLVLHSLKFFRGE